MPKRVGLPTWHDDLAGTLAAAWDLIEAGVADRDAPAHHPVIATIGLDGSPKARVMILRAADRGARTLRVHTDIRSSKAMEIAQNERIAALIYDAPAKMQIRLEGRAELHGDDALADAAWAGSQRMSRACYGTVPASGAEIAAGGAFSLPDSHDAEALAKGRANFAAVIVAVDALEIVTLAHEGHRRARFEWDEKGAMVGRWLVP